jgi:pyridoxine kinase
MKTTDRSMGEPLRKPAVIVISSQVADGTVGNRAAVFAFERLGIRVVAVPTVLLSWHPGKGPATRIVPRSPEFASLIADIAAAPWLGEVGGVLSGYLGDADQAESVVALVEAVKAGNSGAIYLCDPVLGDAAGPYVPEPIVKAVRETLLPLADIATPNRYELGILADEELPTDDGLVAAARAMGVGETVVTSAFAARGEAANLLVSPEGAYRASHPAQKEAPHGTGDLLAALFLAHRLSGIAAPEALRRSAGSIHRLAELAAGAADLPLAVGQAAFFDAGESASLTRIG